MYLLEFSSLHFFVLFYSFFISTLTMFVCDVPKPGGPYTQIPCCDTPKSRGSFLYIFLTNIQILIIFYKSLMYNFFALLHAKIY